MNDDLTTEGWRVAINQDMALGNTLLRAARRRHDGMLEVLVAVVPGRPPRNEHGGAIVRVMPPDVVVPGLLLPVGLVAAIAEAAKPGPSAATVAELRARLEVEQGRVDRLITKALQ